MSEITEPLLQNVLDNFNRQIDHLIHQRTLWMDEHMKDYAKIKIGEGIYDLDTGQMLGIVTGYFRLHSGALRDRSMRIEYQYLVNGHNSTVFDNTSRHDGVSFGTKAEADEKQRSLKYEGVIENAFENSLAH